MTGRYTATIVHHSIASAHTIDCGDDLEEAKKLADAEFGDGFLDHVIIIFENRGEYDETVTSRKIANDEWND